MDIRMHDRRRDSMAWGRDLMVTEELCAAATALDVSLHRCVVSTLLLAVDMLSAAETAHEARDSSLERWRHLYASSPARRAANVRRRRRGTRRS